MSPFPSRPKLRIDVRIRNGLATVVQADLEEFVDGRLEPEDFVHQAGREARSGVSPRMTFHARSKTRRSSSLGGSSS